MNLIMAKKEKVKELEEKDDEISTPLYDEAEARMILGI
jgi:hypothetical protein